MRNTIRAKAIIIAEDKGIKFDKDNNLIGVKKSPLKLYLKNGYPHFNVSIRIGGAARKRDVPVHMLKAYYLYGKRALENGIVVRHLNSNKNDFSDENIKIGTNHDNKMDETAEERRRIAKLAANKLRKFSDAEIIEIRKILCFEINLTRFAKIYNVSISTMSYIKNRRTYADIF